ncbi:MAG: 16S rRNA (uracil(1498)-N(3))-methyltransferase [Pseudomonadota bacterium]|nr:16S rRNA (uracil(1498)-N(3))-methyltransferase [Pseudomonadota bacterium]
MRVIRLYIDAPLRPGADIALPDAAAAHLTRVLRQGAGDPCVLFNGDGNDYPGRITAAGKRETRVAVGAAKPVDRESTLRICLLQGVARGEKMDLILQKATELGVDEIRPLFSERSEVKLDASRAEKRLLHWRSVVVSACEQSGRARIPAVHAPASLAEALEALAAGGARMILDPEGTIALRGMEAPGEQPVVLAVGPEGGWSERDREQLARAGFTGLRLGPRILRTETAGLAAIAVLQARFGDLG